jgi:hypothetical protein
MASVSFWHLLDQGFKRAHFHLQALDLRQYELPSTGLTTGAQFGFRSHGTGKSVQPT